MEMHALSLLKDCNSHLSYFLVTANTHAIISVVMAFVEYQGINIKCYGTKNNTSHISIYSCIIPKKVLVMSIQKNSHQWFSILHASDCGNLIITSSCTDILQYVYTIY